MDAVRSTIEALGGSVELRTQPGVGTTTTLLVPITAAVQRVLLVGVGGESVALPIVKVERILEIPASAVERSGNESFALVDDEPLLVIELADRFRVATGSWLEEDSISEPPSAPDWCAASSTATTSRDCSGRTASGSPNRMWSARLRWKPHPWSGAGRTWEVTMPWSPS